jgi:hypothetical protein
MLSEATKAILVRMCADHDVASCDVCRRGYKFFELAADLVPERRFPLCPLCRGDLTASLRAHTESCPNFAAQKPLAKIDPGDPGDTAATA